MILACSHVFSRSTVLTLTHFSSVVDSQVDLAADQSTPTTAAVPLQLDPAPFTSAMPQLAFFLSLKLLSLRSVCALHPGLFSTPKMNACEICS